jgi:hypothetical protein
MPRTAERTTDERVADRDRAGHDDAVSADRDSGAGGGATVGGGGGGGGPLECVTVNLTPRASRALEIATRLTGDSKTDTLNRAVQIYAFLEETLANGGTVLVQESKDAPPQLIKFF